VLILIGTSPDRQLPTIVSRCQPVRFAPLPAPLVADLLREQGVQDAAVVERLVRMAGGSPGQALALAEAALWDFRRVFLKGLTQPRPDSVALARQWLEFVEEAGKESASQRRRAALVLRLVIDFLHDALRVSAGGTPQLAERGELSMLEELAKRGGPERLIEALERCLEADMQLDRRVQLVLVLEALVDALARPQVKGAG
jgi:DNA polymerase-3 subunit delta'